jgi:cardiolipin synthase
VTLTLPRSSLQQWQSRVLARSLTGAQPKRECAVGPDRLTLLRDGREAFPAMLAAIAAARSSVCLETYILRDDSLGRRFAAALEERARNGVEVNLLYDGWGSTPGPALLHSLIAAGVRVVEYRPIRLRGALGKLVARARRRDHRKCLVVDGAVGFTGGLNLAVVYAAREDGGAGWRDTQLRVEGPGALQLQDLFLRNWRQEGGTPVDESRYVAAPASARPVRILANDLRPDRRYIRAAYFDAIAHAEKRVWITNAYFLPPARLRRALRRAARRGVDVRVILGGTTDVPAVLYAGRSLYPAVLRAGVRIHEWEGSVLHAKTAVIDGHWGTVGSSNLDSLSFFINLEVNAVVEDAAFAGFLEEEFERDLGECFEVTLEALRWVPPWERLFSWCLWLFHGWL